jgi:general secretion pathway protein N
MGAGTLRRFSLALAVATLGAFAGQAAPPTTGPATDGDGNPLWAIGPESLSATRDRPLFSPSRRPPPTVVVAPPPQSVAVVEVKPAAPERPPFMLLGTIVGAEARVALLQNRSSNAVLRVREGEVESGWRALKVDVRSIVLGKGSDRTTLEMPKPGEAGGAASPEGPLAAAPAVDAAVVGAPIAAAATAIPDAPLVEEGPRILPKFRH